MLSKCFEGFVKNISRGDEPLAQLKSVEASQFFSWGHNMILIV